MNTLLNIKLCERLILRSCALSGAGSTSHTVYLFNRVHYSLKKRLLLQPMATVPQSCHWPQLPSFLHASSNVMMSGIHCHSGSWSIWQKGSKLAKSFNHYEGTFWGQTVHSFWKGYVIPTVCWCYDSCHSSKMSSGAWDKAGSSWLILHCKRHKGSNDSKDPQMRKNLIRAILQQMIPFEGGRRFL